MKGIDFPHLLAIAGYPHEPEDFDRLMIDLWVKNYKHDYHQVEQLLYDCLAARRFCERIRSLACVNINDSDILKRLNNLRKGGRLNGD